MDFNFLKYINTEEASALVRNHSYCLYITLRFCPSDIMDNFLGLLSDPDKAKVESEVNRVTNIPIDKVEVSIEKLKVIILNLK